MEVGGEGDYYTYSYTVTTRMTPALRWAVMRAILMFVNCEGHSHRTVSTDHSFGSERRAEADSNRGSSAYQPTALPLGQTGYLLLLIAFIAYIDALRSRADSMRSCRMRFYMNDAF